MRFGIWISMVVATCLTSAGCDSGQSGSAPDRAYISGVVTKDGVPLKGGTVHFALEGSDVMQSTTIIKEDGTYKTDSAPIGDCLVAVETESLKLGAPKEYYTPVPAEYGDPATSGLKVTVKAGEPTVYDIPLKSDAGS